MAMDLGGAKGGLKSDINVTPLVDVMLVLLIIMMLVAPLIQQGVSVRLPQATHTSEKPETQEQAVIAISAGKEVYLNAQPVPRGELMARLSENLKDKKEKIVLIKADKDVDYGTVMQAMDELRQGGIEDIGLITDPKQDLNAAPRGGK
jgi:TolR protein